MGQTFNPTILKPKGWSTTTPAPTTLHPRGWIQFLEAAFGLVLTPSINASVDASTSTGSFGLSVSPSLEMTARGISVAEFGLAVTPSIGFYTPPMASFGLALTPSLSFAAAERYAAAFGLSLSPSLGFSAALAAQFAITVTPSLAFTAAEKMAAAFALGITPSLAFGAAGKSIAAYQLSVTPSLAFSATGHNGATLGFDAASSGFTGSGLSSSISGTDTLSATAGADVFVGIEWRKASGAVAPTRTVTYNGSAMTSLGAIGVNNTALTGNNIFIELFHIASAPGGSQTVSVTVSAASGTFTQLSIASASYVGVSNIGSIQSAFGSSTSNAITATSASGHIPINLMQGAGALSIYNRTQRCSPMSALILGDTTGASSVPFTATNASNGAWADLVVDLS